MRVAIGTSWLLTVASLVGAQVPAWIPESAGPDYRQERPQPDFEPIRAGATPTPRLVEDMDRVNAAYDRLVRRRKLKIPAPPGPEALLAESWQAELHPYNRFLRDDYALARQKRWFHDMGLYNYEMEDVRRLRPYDWATESTPSPLPQPDGRGMMDNRYDWPEMIAVEVEGELVSIPSVLQSEMPSHRPPGSGPVEQGLLTDRGQLFSFIHDAEGAELRWNPDLRGSRVRVTGWIYPGGRHIDVEQSYIYDRPLRADERWLALPSSQQLPQLTPLIISRAHTETPTPTPIYSRTPTWTPDMSKMWTTPLVQAPGIDPDRRQDDTGEGLEATPGPQATPTQGLQPTKTPISYSRPEPIPLPEDYRDLGLDEI